jgi:hypothetical protein
VAAPLANSHADQAIADWYQDHLRSHTLDECGKVGKWFGEHVYTVPIFLAAAWGGRAFDDTLPGTVLNEWGVRTLRTLIAGAPTVGILQVGLGAGRPKEYQSKWRPFDDSNAVAGHGFMGAVPFLTAATMCDNRLGRYALIAASLATSWSRIHDDSHYLSQAILGWWIAYLAANSVDQTQWQRNTFYLVPNAAVDGLGVSVLLEF